MVEVDVAAIVVVLGPLNSHLVSIVGISENSNTRALEARGHDRHRTVTASAWIVAIAITRLHLNHDYFIIDFEDKYN